MVISFYASSCIKKIHDLDSIFAHLGILILRTNKTTDFKCGTVTNISCYAMLLLVQW